MNGRFKRMGAAFALGVLWGCSGGGGTSVPHVNPSASTSPAAAEPATKARFTITVPAASTTSRRFRRPAYVSSATNSVIITLLSVNGTPYSGPSASIATNVTASNPACSGTPLTCTITATAVAGSDVYLVSAYDAVQTSASPATPAGNLLSQASVSVSVVGGTTNTPTTPLVLNGVVDHLDIGLSSSSIVVGTTAMLNVAVNVRDKDNQIIVGPGTFIDANGDALTIHLTDSDGSGATKLSMTSLTAPAMPLTLTYSGAALSAPTISATVSGGSIAGSITGASLTVTNLTPTGNTGGPGPSAALFAAPFYACTRNFYVSTTGNNANPGTQASPWLTIQNADSASRQPGDCINVAPGTYEANVLLTHGGNAPAPTGYIAYRCQTLDGCHVLAPGGGHLWGIRQPANFIVVDGFELDGNNALLTDGVADVCISSDGDTYGTGNSSHHIWVLNNIIHHCNLGGIDLNNKEWYYAIHNTVFHNSFTSGFQGSGIGFVVVQCIESGNANCYSGTSYAGGTGTYVPSGMDLTYAPPFHNIVSGNNVYDNMIAMSNPVACGSHTDGNGIIMDTFADEATLTLVFPFQTLVTGNVSYDNGGRGIHVFRTSNVTVANNTVYGNGTDTCINSFGLADLSNTGGSNNVWLSNISQSVVTAQNLDPGTSCDVSGEMFCGDTNEPLIAGNGAGFIDNNDTYTNNILFGGVGSAPFTSGTTGVGLFNNDLTYFSCSNNQCTTNPQMTNPAGMNFALQPGSPALGGGVPESYLPPTAIDAGACPRALTTCP